MEQFDLIVVGGGAAGLVTAAGSAAIGARVALIEREKLGGECLWTGCVPSKALLACAKAAAHARTASRYGVHAEPRVDFAQVMSWVHGARESIYPHDHPDRFRGMGVDVIEGTAMFTGRQMLEVAGRSLTAKRIVIATGSAPAVPDISGLSTVRYLTNETIFEIKEKPAHLMVLGGGAAGVEMAQAFVRLGSRVTVVERGATFLPREEPELAAMLAEKLRGEGITIETRTSVTAVRRSDFGIVLTLESDGVTRDLGGTHLFVATGRRPRTDTMALEAGGVAVSSAGVQVDETLRTTASGVWACGDCIAGAPRFTHVADYQARLVIRNAFFPLKGKADYSSIPWVTYTDPELAHVGLTEQQARAQHGDVRTFIKPFDDVDRAMADGQTAGAVKLVATSKGRLLGGHILGAGAGDMIGEIALAVKERLSITSIGNLVHSYPTMPEAIRQAAEGYNKARFTGAAKGIAQWFARR